VSKNEGLERRFAAAGAAHAARARRSAVHALSLRATLWRMGPLAA
jgi:hypothetical protein